MSTDASDDGPDDGPDDLAGAEGPAGAQPSGERRRRRRRRRRPGEREAGPEGASATGSEGGAAGGGASTNDGSDVGTSRGDAAAPPPRGGAGGGGDRQRRDYGQRFGDDRGGERTGRMPSATGATAIEATAPETSAREPSPATQPTGDAGERRGRDRQRGGRGERRDGRQGQAGDAQRSAPQPGEPRGDRGRRGARGDGERGGAPQGRDAGGRRDQRGGGRGDAAGRTAPAPRTYEAPTPRLEPQRRPIGEDLDLETAAELPSVAWGTDDEGPAPAIVLASDLPADGSRDDLDPLTQPLFDAPTTQLGEDIAGVVGVRFVPGGRVQWCDSGDADYATGERVLVDTDRGQRLAWIATPPSRRATRDRGLRRVIRRASEHDLRGERDGDTELAKALRIAKDAAAALRLPLKVFRVELFGQGRGAKLNVYYTSDERLDLRDFVRDVGQAMSARIELRQLGVRDEAKAVGGIGSCGLTLCCTTWLPDFVPVSIKMAKDQGLVLTPTKVSGQCGRLKCCLVYEQAGYAEMRKGLPKLGKRVIAPRGEGRVVEVDVLRQRIRVSYGMGDTEVLPASEVKPMFPAGNQPRRDHADRADQASHDDAADTHDLSELPDIPEDPAVDDGAPTDDPSSNFHDPSSDDAPSDA
jgi:cell fate regulator YaaT (PSP1 superfamily)